MVISPVTLVVVPVAGAVAVGYRLWQRQQGMQREAERQREEDRRRDEQRQRIARAEPPPAIPGSAELDLTELGPPGPDQVAGYKQLFSAALEEERFEDAVRISGLLREAGEVTWADNATESIENARKRAG